MDEVKFFMAQDIISVSSKASATEVAQTMVDTKTGSVLIEKDGEYVGILTEGDLSQRVIAKLKKTNRCSSCIYHVSTHYFHRIESTDGHGIFDHGKTSYSAYRSQ